MWKGGSLVTRKLCDMTCLVVGTVILSLVIACCSDFRLEQSWCHMQSCELWDRETQWDWGKKHSDPVSGSEIVFLSHAAGPVGEWWDWWRRALVVLEFRWDPGAALLYSTGWFFFTGPPLKMTKCHYIVNPIKKSVRICEGSGTQSFLGRTSQKNHPVQYSYNDPKG